MWSKKQSIATLFWRKSRYDTSSKPLLQELKTILNQINGLLKMLIVFGRLRSHGSIYVSHKSQHIGNIIATYSSPIFHSFSYLQCRWCTVMENLTWQFPLCLSKDGHLSSANLFCFSNSNISNPTNKSTRKLWNNFLFISNLKYAFSLRCIWS